MRVRLVATVAVLALAGCGERPPIVPTDSPSPAASPSAEPSADVEAIAGPWRSRPIAVSGALTEALRAACAAEAGPDLLVRADELPVAVVDVRGQGRATVLLADESAAVLCEAIVEADGETVLIGVPPARIAPDALDPVDDESIEIVGYATSDEASESRTSIVGRVGQAASDVIAAFDDESEVHASIANGWFLAWWPGAIDAASVAAVDRQNLAIASAVIPRADLEARAGPASWWVDPAAPPTPDVTSISAIIRERACASGRSPEGRVQDPQVFAAEDALLITVWIRALPGDCQGNPTVPLQIRLTEPLGERRLLDGSEIPPRDASVPPD